MDAPNLEKQSLALVTAIALGTTMPDFKPIGYVELSSLTET
jgi:hypothetical protein